MPEQKSPRGGTPEQHSKAGSQSHKNSPSKSSPSRSGSREHGAKGSPSPKSR
jgi:hypothetical protein